MGSAAAAAPSVLGRHGRVAVRRDVALFVGLACVALAMPLGLWIFRVVTGSGHNYNDFHDYWLAGKLLLNGQSPYDVEALRNLAKAEHQWFVVGGGYQYLLPWAVGMLPFSLIPFTPAVLLFNAISLVAFGATTAAWLMYAHGQSPELRPRLFVAACLAGLFPPVYGTVAAGQANLIVLSAVVAGAACAIAGTTRARRAWGGALLGLAAIVKLVPAVLAVPLLLARRFGAIGGMIAAAIVSMAVSVALFPFATAESGGLRSLFEVDSYFTNQSINGFVSRLVRDSERTSAIWLRAFDPLPVMVALTAGLAIATALLLWTARARLSTRRGLAIGIALGLVAGLAGAPKASFWTDALSLVAVGLLFAADAPDLRLSAFTRGDCALLALWYAGAVVQAQLWMDAPAASGGAIVTLSQSSCFYGLIALWLLLARRLIATRPAVASAPTARSAADPALAAAAH